MEWVGNLSKWLDFRQTSLQDIAKGKSCPGSAAPVGRVAAVIEWMTTDDRQSGRLSAVTRSSVKLQSLNAPVLLPVCLNNELSVTTVPQRQRRCDRRPATCQTTGRNLGAQTTTGDANTGNKRQSSAQPQHIADTRRRSSPPVVVVVVVQAQLGRSSRLDVGA